MGLDQYAYTKKGKKQIGLQYWRKHNALQGWMENLWEERGRPRQNKNDLSFNGVPLQLSAKHIDRLEQDIIGGNLPETQGFFFGADSRDDDYCKEKTLAFIATARQAIKDGEKVFYNSSW